TLMSLELAVAAMKQGSRAVFFTLECMHADILDRFRDIGVDPAVFDHLFEFDNSDAISATYIIEELGSAPRGTLAVIDYLQLLDQKREDPELMVQIRALRSFARERGLVLVFISQVDRSYDASRKPFPDLDDVRLPNPLDLSLFDKMCFLN
ncbi:MAG: DNA helicase, partial [Mesorhizobium sp.]